MMREVFLFLVTFGLLAGCGQEDPDSAAESEPTDIPRGPLIVYASHEAARMASALDTYRLETGTRFQLLSDELPEKAARLDNPKFMPEADLFVAGSLAELWSVAEIDALRPIYSDVLSNRIARPLRDPESRWIALATRARIVVYNTELVTRDKLASLTDYTSLGGEAWRGSLCLASSAVPGNRSLIAFLIKRHDVQEVEIAVRKWRDNLATSVFANDVELLQAVSAGQCAVGIADSNVLAALRSARPDAPVAPHWFDTEGNTLIDISGAGVTRHATNPDGAAALLEWMTKVAPNALFATRNFEFPANDNAPAGAAIEEWSQHMTEPAPLSDLGFLLDEADKLIERARYP